jgi:serine/threonine protein kinase
LENSPSPDLGETLHMADPPVTLEGSLAAWKGGSLPGPRSAARDSVLPRVATVGGALHMTASEGPRYAPLRPLGRGGMGEVELVEDRDIGRPVAVKRLLPEALQPAAVARFAEEVRTIGRLEHPNIVPIHDVGVDAEGRLFFVMKYVDGETLEAIIARLRAGDPQTVARYDVPRRVQIFEGLLRALDFAHGRGILHRDLKPANVMVGRHGEVVLMDWGVAGPIRGPSGVGVPASAEVGPLDETAVDTRPWETRAGALVGTPQYMSPEQALGENDRLDARSDLYSACVLFHELLGLRHRHADARSLMGLLVAIHAGAPPKAASMFPAHPANPDGVPAEYGYLIERGLARDPAERWGSAAELLAELWQIQRGACRVQCPVTFSRRVLTTFGRLLDRHHLVGAVAISGGLMLLGVLVVKSVLELVLG